MTEISYLKSLEAVRERSFQIFSLNEINQLKHFDIDLENLDKVSNKVIELIKRDYQTIEEIPPHARWRHLDVGNKKRVNELINIFNVDDIEKTRRIIDLMVVSVLLDAGAGDKWIYIDENGHPYGRSEGLALASLNMFKDSSFSTNEKNAYQVDSKGLMALQIQNIRDGFQVNEKTNPLVGVEGRLNLLVDLGKTLELHKEYFYHDEVYRPGNMIDYLLKTSKDDQNISIKDLWEIIVYGLAEIWPPSRTKIEGVSLGDVWPSDDLGHDYSSVSALNPSQLVPFHKLSQWLTYSIMEPITAILKIKFTEVDLLTGLPEYRNGGLFVDMKVLNLKQEDLERGKKNQKNRPADGEATFPTFEPNDPVIIEWRALTICLLDLVSEDIRKKLDVDSKQLPLAKVLESGTWKAGREIAAQLRPHSKGPPIVILSDGTLF